MDWRQVCVFHKVYPGAMRACVFIAISFLSFTFGSFAQTTWERTYGIPNRWEDCYSVTSTYDNGFLFAINFLANTNPGNPLYASWLLKTDINGFPLWSKYFYNPFFTFGIFFIESGQNGNIIAIGQTNEVSLSGDSFIMLLDACGEKIWCKRFHYMNMNYGWRVRGDSLGNFVLYTRSASNIGLIERNQLWKFDSIGDLIFYAQIIPEYEYPDIDDPSFYDFICTPDNGFLLSGYGYMQDTTSPQQWWRLQHLLVKTDSLGNEVWVRPDTFNLQYVGALCALANYNDYYFAVSTSSITYIFHPQNNSSRKIIPDKVNPPPLINVVQYNYQFSTYDKPACCSQTVYPEGSREELRAGITYSENKIDSIEQLLTQFIDAGATDTLHDEVATSFASQSYEVYQDLMAASPYLSDTVLKKSIEREDVLPNVMIRDIMVANPQSAKDDSILTVLDNRFNPMPDSLYAQILGGAEILGAKEVLENKLSHWKQKRQMNFRALMHLFKTDTVNSWAQDSLVVLLESEPTLSSKYSLLLNYIDNYQFGRADTLLQNIPSGFMLSPGEMITYHRYDSLLALLQLIYIDSLGYRIPDSTHLPLLQGLSGNQSDLPGVFARNILVSFGLMEYEESYIIQPSLKSTRRIKNVSKTNPESPLKVFPNPCSDFVTVEYLSPESLTGKVITIYSAEGKPVFSRPIERTYNQFIIPMTSVKPGIYLVEITTGNKSIATKKLIVTK